MSFETERFVFDDPFQVSRQDRVEDGKEPWQTMGLVGDVALLSVAHTWLDQDGEEHVRIISARLATGAERKRYENAT